MTSPTPHADYRPSIRLMAVIGVLTFIVMAVALAPASLIAPAFSNTPASYERIEGRIWNGRIKRLNIDEHYLGDIDFRLSLFQMLLGRVSADIKAQGGAGEGAGKISVGLFDQSLRVEDADIRFDLTSVKRYTIFGLPYRGDLRASIDRLTWTRRGCRAASGDVWTDLLDASSRELVGEGMELAGAVACDGDTLTLVLDGENGEGRASIHVGVTPDMTYQLIASVAPARQELHDNLKMLGFEDKGANLVFDAMGALKGIGS